MTGTYTDVVGCTLCANDGQGLFQYVAYPNNTGRQFSFNEAGLECNITPSGNVLEVKGQGKRKKASKMDANGIEK